LKTLLKSKGYWSHCEHGILDLIKNEKEQVVFRAASGIWIYVNKFSYPQLQRKLAFNPKRNLK
jgi:hypothetical protein